MCRRASIDAEGHRWNAPGSPLRTRPYVHPRLRSQSPGCRYVSSRTVFTVLPVQMSFLLFGDGVHARTGRGGLQARHVATSPRLGLSNDKVLRSCEHRRLVNQSDVRVLRPSLYSVKLVIRTHCMVARDLQSWCGRTNRKQRDCHDRLWRASAQLADLRRLRKSVVKQHILTETQSVTGSLVQVAKRIELTTVRRVSGSITRGRRVSSVATGFRGSTCRSDLVYSCYRLSNARRCCRQTLLQILMKWRWEAELARNSHNDSHKSRYERGMQSHHPLLLYSTLCRID